MSQACPPTIQNRWRRRRGGSQRLVGPALTELLAPPDVHIPNALMLASQLLLSYRCCSHRNRSRRCSGSRRFDVPCPQRPEAWNRCSDKKGNCSLCMTAPPPLNETQERIFRRECWDPRRGQLSRTCTSHRPPPPLTCKSQLDMHPAQLVPPHPDHTRPILPCLARDRSRCETATGKTNQL